MDKNRQITPAEVARKWNVSHLMEVNDVERWRGLFIALGQATIMLRNCDEQIQNMAILVAQQVEEIKVLSVALQNACSAANLDRDQVFINAIDETSTNRGA